MKRKILPVFFISICGSLFAQRKNIVDYFIKEIDDTSNATLPSHAFRLSELHDERENVWKSWVAANEQLKDYELPSPSLYRAPAPHSWKLIDEDPMPFYYLQKGNNKPANGFPLFIAIHGSGPKEDEWPATVQVTSRYKDSPSIYFIPQIPSEERYRWWYRPEQRAWERLFKLAMLSQNIDPNKIYFTGISEGGYGSQRLGAFYADYLAGAGPMAGGEPLENAPPLNYRNVAFAFETGEDDNGFGRRDYTLVAQKAFDSLQKIYPENFVHKIELQKNRGHFVNYNLVTPWLIQYKRNPYPKHVSWVDFPMHNRYRNGFYNLCVLDQFNINDTTDIDRAVFDMQIDSAKNEIHLSAQTLNYKTGKYGKITKGKLGIYLSPELIDMSKKIILYLNGKKYFSGKLKADEKFVAESCALFGDPYRLYPSRLDVDFTKL